VVGEEVGNVVMSSIERRRRVQCPRSHLSRP
jgi:hypothetical protein